MNKTDDISTYNSNNSHYYSPVLARRHGGHYDVQKSPKKDKKWSFGNLFRLKKKNGSDSSTEEEVEHKFFLQKKKKKTIKRKHSNKTTGFDHVVIPPSSRYNNHFNEYKKCEDPSSILSEPNYSNSQIQSKNYVPASAFTKKAVPLNDTREHVERNYINRSINNTGFPSSNTLGKFKKEYVKARAEARRDTSNGGDSSGDESQKSAFKSDESLCINKDGVLRKKSRAARTQRYLKRISKDDDNGDSHNNINLKTSNSDLENLKITTNKNEALPRKFIDKSYSENFFPGRSQLYYTNSAPSRTNLTGISTIPPKHDFQNKYRTISSTNGSLYKQNNNLPQEYNDMNKSSLLDLNNHRSLSCEANIHRSQNEVGVINGCLPLRKPSSKRVNGIINSLYSNDKTQSPPPPPPRDPKRMLHVQNSDTRPNSYSFDNGHLFKVHCDRKICKSEVMPESGQNLLNPNNRSTSEDHIFLNPMQRIPLLPRPSSTTPETNRLQKLHQSYCDAEKANDYRYLTDKNPRSRKPICIRSSNSNLLAKQNSNSTVNKTDNKSQNTFEFWKQKDEENTRIHNNNNKLPLDSNRMFTAYTHVRNNVFLPNGNKVETLSAITNGNNVVNNLNDSNNKTNPLLLQDNKVDPVLNDSVDSSDRKSSNLEDALDELEAIYNSLHLGDEDLLDRAEQRELDAVQKQRDSTFESYPSSFSKGALSDSCYGYDQNLESTRRKRLLKRNETDRSTDDMAFRKLNKNRHNTVGDQQSSVAKISYLLTSPIFGATPDEDKSLQNKAKSKEPDITFDDVVYRNVKHSKNTLKVVDPQPPFGIPVGPISLASPTDYLHVSLEESKPSTNEPDVIKDDLAYRNLRKDSTKKSSSPNQNLSVVDDFINNNNNFQAGETFKKKRAVRSLSANIYNLMHKEPNFDKPIKSDAVFNENISDIADALEIAREILRKKENKITSVRKAYMSDDELKKRKLNDFPFNSPPLNGENSYQSKVRVNIPTLNSDSCDITYKVRESTPIVKDGDLTNELSKESALDELITSLSLGTFNDNDKSSDETDKSVKLEHIIKELKSEENYQDSNTDMKSVQCNQDRVVQEDEVQDLNETRSSSLSQLLSEIDSFAEQSTAGEDILNPVSNTSPYLVATRVESEPFEQVSGIQIEPVVYETVANVILTPSNNLNENVITTEVFSDSEHDYANILSNEDIPSCIEDEEKSDLNDSVTFLKNEDDLSDEISNDIKLLSSFLEGSTDVRSQECCHEDNISHNTLKLSPFFQPSVSEVSEKQFLSDGSLEDRDDKNEGEKNSEMLCAASSAAMCVLTNKVCFNINHSSSSYLYNNLNNDSLTRDNERGNVNIEEKLLESLKAPKLVQNLSFSSNSVKSSFCGDEDVKVSLEKIYNENVDESYFPDSILENFNNPILNNTDCCSSSNNIPIVPDESHNSIQSNTCDTKEINESRINQNCCRFSKNHLNLVNVDNCIEEQNNDSLIAEIGEASRDQHKSVQDEDKNDFCLKNKLHNEAGSSQDKLIDTRKSSCSQEPRCSPESNSNHSWYEDPSVIALACSCGIACTSQLPSFDIIFMLGLLFAVISLLLALISRF